MDETLGFCFNAKPITVEELQGAMASLPEGTQVLRISRDDGMIMIGLGLDSATYEGEPEITITLRLPKHHVTRSY